MQVEALAPAYGPGDAGVGCPGNRSIRCAEPGAPAAAQPRRRRLSAYRCRHRKNATSGTRYCVLPRRRQMFRTLTRAPDDVIVDQLWMEGP